MLDALCLLWQRS